MNSDKLGNSPDSIPSSNSTNSPSKNNLSLALSLAAAKKKEKQLIRRRKHKNSKLGCPTCKTRRVKCSEEFPSCENCIKHKVPCGYLDYTPDQIEELMQAKLARSEEFDQPRSRGSLEEIKYPPIDKEEINQSSSFNNAVPLDNQRSIVQDFDNLLTTGKTEDQKTEIIYPVYSIHKDTPRLDSINLETLLGQFHNMSTDPQYQTLFKVRQKREKHKGLACSISVMTTFEIKPSRTLVNYNTELTKALIKLREVVSAGAATLPSIRHLYHIWINSLIYNSSTSQLLFSCLINLTTNYVISNYFNNLPSYRKAIGDTATHVDRTQLKNFLILKSIKHYAVVIKELRDALNKNVNQDQCASASYMLLLMSIYDPEVTVDSTLCFRDGLFGVLTYNMSESIRTNKPIHPIIGVHLQLMKNITRSVYLPAYDPEFLKEYQQILRKFGTSLKKYMTESLEKLEQLSPAEAYLESERLAFLELKLDDLSGFVNHTIKKYIPEINLSLDNIDKQKVLLFDMVYTWVRLLPSRLLIITPNMTPLLKVVYLFYKVLNKALFAIFPQIKFFFLRDFDSPLMTDVFQELNNLHKCVIGDQYIQLDRTLRNIGNYAIRVIIYFESRLGVLYKSLVYDERFKLDLAVDDIRTWTSNVHSIADMRNDFIRITETKEVSIRRFLTTLIEKKHYPFTSDENVITPDPTVASAEAAVAIDYEEIEEDESESDQDMFDEDFNLTVLNSGRLTPSGMYDSDFHIM